MRTSAPLRGEGHESGFTLVELLIVMVVMGLLSAAVVIAMPDPEGSVTAEAQRFAARAKAARDKAILDGRAMSVRLTQDGYRFEQRRGGAWQPVGTAYRWTDGTTRSGAARLLFDATGLAEPATLTLVRQGARARVDVDGGGEIRVAA